LGNGVLPNCLKLKTIILNGLLGQRFVLQFIVSDGIPLLGQILKPEIFLIGFM
jgi:hypothetical protein